MAKIISLIIIALMLIQLIRPLGIPGFKKRKDFWKMAPVALLALVLSIALGQM